MKVYLIGAGPGDPGLLTIKGKKILQQADVIMYDFLVNEILLNYAKSDAEIIYVGKKGNSSYTSPQDEITQLLINKAKEGKIVARLKGGDPYIFGRGAEEAEALVLAGIPFEEIPGITSTIAAPAYAGIPLTHRDYTSSVTFITGHEDPGKIDSAHNWSALAHSANTLVFVMGMKNLSEISKNLIQEGLSPDTPAAVIFWGTTAKHKSLVSTVKNIPEEAKKNGFTNPSIIVIGKVVKFHSTLNWFEQKPLLGKSIVVTRAREQASSLASLLTELGAEVIQFPTIDITPVTETAIIDQYVHKIKEYDWIIFTSVNGVRFFWERLITFKLDARVFAGVSIVAIGPATAEAIREKGIQPDFVPEEYIAESIADGLIEHGVKGKRILLPRAQEAREVLPNKLRKAGATVDIVPVYETRLAIKLQNNILQLLEQGALDCITFASSSTVENFFEHIPITVLKKYRLPKFATIGPVTSNTLKKHGFDYDIQPTKYTIPDLVNAIVDTYKG